MKRLIFLASLAVFSLGKTESAQAAMLQPLNWQGGKAQKAISLVEKCALTAQGLEISLEKAAAGNPTRLFLILPAYRRGQNYSATLSASSSATLEYTDSLATLLSLVRNATPDDRNLTSTCEVAVQQPPGTDGNAAVAGELKIRLRARNLKPIDPKEIGLAHFQTEFSVRCSGI